MGDADLIVAVPWLVFAVGLAAIGLRLVAGRHRRGRRSSDAPADPARQPHSNEKAPRAPGG